MQILTREAIEQLIFKNNVSNRSIETYIATVAMSETLGDNVGIINFCPHRLYLYMVNDLNMNWISKSGFYKSFESLMQCKLINYYPEKELLLIPHLTSFYRKYSRGYITIPLICFKYSFHILPLGCKKLFFKFFSMIGNNPNKILYYNVLKHEDELKKICRVNRKSKLYELLYKSNILFDIKELSNLVLEVKLSPILSLKTENIPLNFYHSAKTKLLVIKELCSYGYSYGMKELKSICSASEGVNFKVVRQALKEYVFNPRKTEIVHLKFYIQAVIKDLKPNALGL